MITPPPLPTRRFKFPALAFLFIAAGWGLSFFSAVDGPSGETTAGIVGFRLGQGAMLFGMPLLITWALWKLCRLRPEGTTITAWIVSAVFVAGSIAALSKEVVEKRDSNRRQTKELQAQMRQQRQASLAPDASYEEVQKAQRKTAEIIRESGQKMTGDDGKILRAMSGPVEELQRESAALVQVAAEMTEKPVLDTSTIKDLEEIDRRLARVEQLRQTNQNLTAAILNFEDNIHQAIQKSGAGESKQNAEWRGFQSSFGKQKALLLQMRALDDELAGRMKQVLSLLRDEWGKWEHNETNSLIFESENSLSEYNRQIERIQKIADEETKIQARLLIL